MNETQQKKRLKLLRDESQLKRHYKMFKTNKGWLVAAISLLIFSGGVAFNQPVVHAEEATTTSVSESSVTSDASSVSSVKSESTSAASVATTASSTESTAVGSEQSSSAAASSSSASSAVSSVSKETSLATSVTTKIAKSSSTDSVTNSATSLSLSSASSSDATSSNTSSAANTSGNQTSSATSQVASSAVTSGASNSSLRSASSLNSNSNTESASNSASNASTSLSSFASDASQYVNGETLVDPTAEDIANAEAAGSAVYAATGESQSFSTVSAAAVSEAASSSAVASSAAADTVNFWTPGSDVNANANTGTYGGDLKNYVYTGDPFASTVDGTVDIVAKTPVVAKGIYGTVKWYISDGVLHLGAGTPIASNTSKAANPQLPLNLVSPWKQYQSEFTTISIDGKITLKNGNSYLFGSLDQTTAITGAENLDFSSATDITGMFRGTTKLLSISGTGLGTGSWNMSSVTSASSMFLNDSALLTLDVSNWGMNSATSFASMFLGAKSLTTITGIENWTTNSLNNTYAMFDGATSLQSLDLSKWNTSLVTSMAYMFRNNTSLNSLNVSNWNTSKLVNGVDKNGNPSNGIENMFSGASSIKQLDLSSWSTSALTSMTNVFSGMTSLKQITFGSGFVTTNVTGGSVALPNTTSTTKWVNVGSGTTAKPQASTVITAYPGTGADTYVLKTIASATLSSPTVTYNGKNASEAAGLTATVGSKVIPLSSKDVVVTKNSAAVNSTGYKYTLNSTGIQTVLTALGTDYILSSANVTPGKIIIAKAAATGSLTLDSTGKTYDGNEVSVKPTISFTTNDGSPAPSYILQAGDYEVVDNGSAVKDYTVQLTAAGIKNIEANMNYTFDLSNATAKYTISAATGTIQLSGQDGKTYDRKAGTIDESKYKVELSNGEKYTLQAGDLEFKTADPTDAGTYDVQLSAAGIENLNKVDPNYQYTADSVSGVGQYTISAATGTIQLSGQDGKTYDRKAGTIDESKYKVELSNGEKYTLQAGDLEFKTADPTDVGTYDVQLSAAGIANLNKVDPNYQYTADSVSGVGHYTISAATGTIQLSGQNGKTYDGKAGTLDESKYSVELSNGEKYTLQAGDLEFKTADPTDVGTYDVQLSAAGIANLNKVDPNYQYTADSVSGVGQYTILPATTDPSDKSTSFSVSDATSYYGENSPTFVVTPGSKVKDPGNLTNDDFTFIDKVTGQVVDGVPTNVGSYEVILNESGKAKVAAANPNYNFSDGSFVSGTYTIHDVITHSQVTVTRTVHYTGAGARTPKDVVQTLIYDVATSKATGVSTYTPQGSYAAVNTPEINGFKNSGNVSEVTPTTSTSEPTDLKVTVTYTPINEIEYSEITVTRTIHYQGAGNKTPHDVVETVVYKVATNKTTGEVSYTPQGVYEAVHTPDLAGYSHSGDVAELIPNATMTQPENSIVVVRYQAIKQPGEVGPGHKPEAPNTGNHGGNGGQDSNGSNGHNAHPNSGHPLGEQNGTHGSNVINGVAGTRTTTKKNVPLTHATQGKLPQTDENKDQTEEMIGVSLLGMMLALFGIKRRKHDEN